MGEGSGPAWHSLACPVATRCGAGGAAASSEGCPGFSIRYWGLLLRCEMSGRLGSKGQSAGTGLSKSTAGRLETFLLAL